MEIKLGYNINNKIKVVNHKDLKRASENSSFRSTCPVCKEGILPVRRDEKTFKILKEDNCLLCGQKFYYKDLGEKNG